MVSGHEDLGLENRDRSYRGSKRRSPSYDRSHTHKRRRYDGEEDGRRSRGHPSEPRSPDRHEAVKRRSRSEEDRRARRDASPRSRDRRREIKERSRSRSPSSRHKHRRVRRHRSRSRSRSPKHRRRPPGASTSPQPGSRKPLPSQDQSYWGQEGVEIPQNAVDKPQEKQKPNYKPSGLLAAESNKVTVSGGAGKDPQNVVLKYHEPSEARKPPSSQAWACYVFKGDAKDPLQTIQLHTRSCWLLGRETTIADIPTEHPSCSKQHAVFQFRHITTKDEWGEKKSKVGLYLIDLESANGSSLNGEKVEQARYVECLNGDVFKFGESEREYVVLLPPK